MIVLCVTGNTDTQFQTESVARCTNSCVSYTASFAEKYIHKAECATNSWNSLHLKKPKKEEIMYKLYRKSGVRTNIKNIEYVSELALSFELMHINKHWNKNIQWNVLETERYDKQSCQWHLKVK
jgi:hypothetical protein